MPVVGIESNKNGGGAAYTDKTDKAKENEAKVGKCDGDGGHQNNFQSRVDDIGLNGHNVDHVAAVDENREEDWAEVGGCQDSGSSRLNHASTSFVSNITPGEAHEVNAAGDASTLIMPIPQVEDVARNIFNNHDNTQIISQLEELDSATIEAVLETTAKEMRGLEEQISVYAEKVKQAVLNADVGTEGLMPGIKSIVSEAKPSQKKRKLGTDNLNEIKKWLKRCRTDAS